MSGRAVLVDGHAQAAQVVGVGAHRVEAAAVGAEDAPVRPQRDAEVLEALVAARARRRRRQDVERELEIGRTARERPGDAERRREQLARHRRDVAAHGTSPKLDLWP